MNELDFLKYLLENLVNNPDDVKIERTEDEMWILLTVSLNSEDMGLIIWKSGSTINSIRTIVRLFGTKAWKRINLKVLG